jgi:undecaprenyl-diphosphatase
VALLARRWPHVDPRPDEPLAGWARRLDPGAATGLALSVALVVLVGGGLLLVLLAFLLRGDPDAIGLDAAAAKWGAAHATPFTNDVLVRLTNVGRPNSVILLAAALAVVQTIRTRNLWIAPFLIVVVAGNGFVTTTIKHFADRVRPSFNPAAAALGPSFPSGHSSWTAAFFAAAALVLAREATRRQRVVLAGLAAGMAAAIASTRVLLDVHWVSDVVAGVVLGWAWFAACAIAFGGRLVRFGATAEAALEDGDDGDRPARTGERRDALVR